MGGIYLLLRIVLNSLGIEKELRRNKSSISCDETDLIELSIIQYYVSSSSTGFAKSGKNAF